ncbi:sulfatase-like hydrolase/transferase [Wielerella bovis]|uniref:sulfatase-like hydrolase/transferase n=1 Tax=Wielerella bovis TaxID=2917790 RepID=UPI0020197060|nr:sulfatase-like hydrolase/transferase [Wielerella bovis]MCG7656167.1 sulfatase-like hydrolase/transferase [Wielerella bovis]MCG7658392.1 sulfatase-like hydrolase/transferase [Wielerella bovis]
MKNILTADFKIPAFLYYSWRDIGKALMFILLPNIFLDITAFSLGISRPLINWDYAFPTILMLVSSPFIKFIAVALFLFFLLFDIVMLTMQIFPFMDLAAISYLAPFIVNAPLRYIIIVVVGAVYALVMPAVMWKSSQYVKTGLTIALYLLLLAISYDMRFAKYVDETKKHPDLFGMGNHYFGNSQVFLFERQMYKGFFQAAQEVPDLIPAEYDAARFKFMQPQSDKLLLIIAESWGYPVNPEVQRATLQKIYDKQNQLEFLHDGKLTTTGSTVQGELRELCRLDTRGGYALRNVPSEKYADCFPNQLKKLGYQTIAMHGASSLLYDRNSWYEKAGFDKTWFPEKMPSEKRCYAFNGICDSELLPYVRQAFADNPNGKTFFYWLTLTAHVPYATEDMRNPRLNCAKYQLPEGDICNNMRLETQFFDDFAKLIDDPAMKGVEVIIVGDHMPPIMGTLKPIHHHLNWTSVSWVHFKIK